MHFYEGKLSGPIAPMHELETKTEEDVMNETLVRDF